MSKSSVLGNLEVETDYIVSVIAINECGVESQPSNITVRIDMNGMLCTACVHMYCNSILCCGNRDYYGCLASNGCKIIIQSAHSNFSYFNITFPS